MENFDNLVSELYSKAYIGKCKHFNAANRNKVYKHWTQIPIIIINISLGSLLFANLSVAIPLFVKWISAVLAFGAAILGGLQNYFDYQKRFDMHNRLGNEFLSVEHKLHKLHQLYKMQQLDLDESLKQFDSLESRYQAIVIESIPFPTNKPDFSSAIKSMNEKKEKNGNTLFFK